MWPENQKAANRRRNASSAALYLTSESALE